jgi:ferredoxin-NADP reductase/MOSC domain-containing protein YiiM
MARLVSVNVGLPRDIEWRGRTVRTAVWKYPVSGRCRVRRMSLDGDGQGDLAGHGGEQRAVFVYQLEAYEYWQVHLNRADFVHGQFGENFTIEGLPDNTVCVGDRYRIGTALFEVTQPRVTCYRVGIRMNEPQMPRLLTSSGLPGFYFRVLREGEVGAGDEIVKTGEARERMTIAEINALLYSSRHPTDLLERALQIQALSPGWRRSFEALLRGSKNGNAGLAPEASAHPAASGFGRVVVTGIDWDSADVLSLTMSSADGRPLAKALPGQYVVLRLPGTLRGSPLFRSYSLSGPVSTEYYRISVKIERDGAAGTWLRDHVQVSDVLAVSSPRGNFILRSSERPVVLLSAGIGATPVLAMLHSLAAGRSTRQILWLHAARDREHHPFAAEARLLIRALPRARTYVCYSRPGPLDQLGRDFNAAGHLSRSLFEDAALPQDAEVYLCGPKRFMADMKTELAAVGVAPGQIQFEVFDGNEPMTPGVVHGANRIPHAPKDDAEGGPLISFARSGVVAHWRPSIYHSLLELAEACDVPVSWSCRSGVCHNCESGLVAGTVLYLPEPLDEPADGNVLVCCAQPAGDVVIDL